jgi:hypothetical protein
MSNAFYQQKIEPLITLDADVEVANNILFLRQHGGMGGLQAPTSPFLRLLPIRLSFAPPRSMCLPTVCVSPFTMGNFPEARSCSLTEP